MAFLPDVRWTAREIFGARAARPKVKLGGFASQRNMLALRACEIIGCADNEEARKDLFPCGLH